MTNIKNFNALSILLAERGVKKRIVVVNPDDESTLWALDKARRSGFCETIIIDDDDRPTAAQKAVQLVREGKADVLMKGFINTDVLLHAILNKEYGILEPGSVMTHITAASLPVYDKLIFFTDAAVIPYPTQEQRVQQVRYMVNLCHSFGIDVPRVSLIHSSEKVDARHFPYTEGYVEIKKMAQNGEVSDVYSHEGELVGMGSPIMSISLIKDMWGSFNVREDQFNGMKIGSVIHAFVPAFNKTIRMKVYYVKDQGSYAAWRATKNSGQYDLKTLEVKARPIDKIDGLRPGMSLVLKNADKK